MSCLVPAGTPVVFTPGPGWAWVGFDGRVPAAAATTRFDLSGGNQAVTGDDLTGLAAELVGRSYLADGHNTPGSATAATMSIDPGTLSDRVSLADRPVATSATTGTFRLTVRPSVLTGTTTVTDTTVREGTWAVPPPARPRTDC